MQLDRLEGKPDARVAWGSDIAAQMLRRFGIRYISLNPGASYRGFHDSLVNHLGNENPGIILCLHEDHSVAIAHGYAKATGEPMACVLHTNVGLLHGMMGLFNAWCDRAPMFVLGATGPVAAEKRRPWIDWIHTSRDQGAYIRSIIKWDDQPTSPDALVESMTRANMLTRSAPTAPVYICLDAGFQEQRLDKEPEWPDVKRFQPPTPPRPSQGSGSTRRWRCSRARKSPSSCSAAARARRSSGQPRIKLAEQLGACVVTDLKQGAMFPTDHPAHYCPPFNALGQDARKLLCEADVILALDWVDLGGALRQAKSVGTVGAKIIACSLDQNLHTGANMEYQALPPVDVAMASTGDVVVAELNDALGGGRKDPWKVEGAGQGQGRRRRGASRMEQVASTLRDQFNDPENVTFCTLGRGWPFDVWPLQNGMAYLGKDGGGGLGSGPGHFGRLGAGAARAGPLRHLDARRRRFLHGRDRDLERGAPSHSAARPDQQQPLLLQRRTASGQRRAHARPRGQEPLDRSAHGRSDRPTSPSSPRRRVRSASGRSPSAEDVKAAMRRASTCSRRAASA